LTVLAVAISAAAIAAVTCVALTKVVALVAPLNFTTDDETNPVPFTVRVNAVPPAVALVGMIEVAVGAGLLIVNVWPPEVPPPGAGFVTVTFAVPAVAISAAEIAAVNCAALTNVVVFDAPLNFTTDVDTKPEPFTVRVKPAPPAVALVGEIDVSTGTGLLIAKACAFDVPPPGAGFVTVTFTDPAVAISAAGIVARICVAVMEDGVIAGFAPKFTVAPLTKPLPFRVKVNDAPPAVTLDGESDVRVGAPAVTLKFTEPLVPPPGVGFVTTTGKLPTEVMSDARIAAVTCVELTNVVVRAVPLNFTTEPLTKLLPFTVRVNADPLTVALVGEIVVMAGTGLLAVKVCDADVPPPGAGLVTVTLIGPAGVT